VWILGGIQQKKKMEPVSNTMELNKVRVSVSLLDTSAVGNMGVGLEEVEIVPVLPLLI